MPNTVRLHRVFATKREKVYRAFIEPDAIAKWLPPNGFTCTVHHPHGPQSRWRLQDVLPELHGRLATECVSVGRRP